MLLEGAGDRLAVVPRDHDRGRRLGRRHPGTAGHPERRHPRAAFGEQAVGVAVVGAGKLDDDLAPGDRPGQADRAHRRLGPGAGHPHHPHRREALDDLLGQLDLDRGRGPEAGPPLRRLDHRRDNRGLGVAEDHRAPGADPVQVAPAGHVDQFAALAAFDEDRVAADLPHRPHRAVHPADQNLQRPLVQPLRTRNAAPPRRRTRR